MGTVYAKGSMGVGWDGGSVMLVKGKPWDDSHPLVRARPGLFTDAPPDSTVAGAPRVERATRAPGEVRGPKPGPPR